VRSEQNSVPAPRRSYLTFEADPQSLTWDPFDEELRQKLDRRSYVSLSQDQALAAEASAKNSDETEALSTAVTAGGARLDKLDKPDTEVSDDTDISLFDVNMPGVLTRQELEEQVDLDHWLLVAHGVLVEMIVRPFISSSSPPRPPLPQCSIPIHSPRHHIST